MPEVPTEPFHLVFGVSSPGVWGARKGEAKTLAFILTLCFEGGRRFHPANSWEQEEEAAGNRRLEHLLLDNRSF